MNIPSKITAGDSISWLDEATKDELNNPIDSTWTLKYILKQGTTSLTLTAAADGDGWKTSITKTQSSTFAAGQVFWQSYAEKASDRKTLGTGQVTFLQDMTTATGTFDGRTQLEKDLAAVQAAMRGIYTDGISEYQIMGRSIRKMPMEDLILLESKLKYDILLEKQKLGINTGRDPRTLKVRFSK